jgi:hypothetical protein
MSYNLYITRKLHWFDDSGLAIAPSEWRAVVESDPGLKFDPSNGEYFAIWKDGAGEEHWIDWDGGNLESKNPSAQLIGKMVAVASILGARVVGEEEEVYGADGVATPWEAPRELGMFAKLSAWWKSIFIRSPAPVEASELPFIVGTKVRDAMGRVGTVTRIDVGAEHGLGVISVRLHSGETVHVMAIAHCLEPVE